MMVSVGANCKEEGGQNYRGRLGQTRQAGSKQIPKVKKHKRELDV